MTVSGKLYTPPQYHKSLRCLITAKYTGVSLDQKKYIPGVTDKDKEYADNFPANSCPAFIGKDKKLFETNAISHFIGNEKLRGGKNEKLVNEWVTYTDSHILPSVGVWVYNDLKICDIPKDVYGKAKANVIPILKRLNQHLSQFTYLVGEEITQADITLFTVIQMLYSNVYDENQRSLMAHLTRWYMTIANQSEVMAVCGQPLLYMKPVQTKVKEEKKPQPKKEAKKAEPKPAEQPKPKKEDKLALLDKGTFDMDEWKRMFSNNDLDKVALPWFMKNFDAERYSVWYCVYNYPEDLNLIFQSNNLIGGMFQRLEEIKKMAFAGQHVYGKDKDNQISGVWFWRGPNLIFDLSEDIQTDFESYTWKKLDPKKPEDFKLMRDHWAGEGKYHGKDYADGKIFK